MKSSKNMKQLLIPKEHGTWAMWVLPFIVGIAAAGKMSIESYLIFGVSLLAFFVRTALASAIRIQKQDRKLMQKCFVAAFAEIVLMFVLISPMLLARNYAVVVIGVLASGLLIADVRWISDRSERHLSIELLGVAGFALAAPAAFVATTGAWHFEAAVLWFISFAYFSGSVFYVKLRLARLSKKKNEIASPYSRLVLGYTILVSAMTLSLYIFGWTPVWLIFAFLPWIVHLLWEVFYFQKLQNINRVGWTLVAHSLYFTVFVSLIFVMN